ncbi:MAG: hypothetical protein HYU51_18160 [Candidatus Rokubacteria bacterium]|nr:hypothetical protein [Candidatus Rokubacteria bacterium]
MKRPASVEAFTLAAIEGLGGAAEEQAPGLYTVLWPPEDDAGDVETRRLAFDPDAIEEDGAAELVTFASPTLERIVRLATASGRVARAFLGAPAQTRGITERLARSYHVLDASWTPRTGRPWWVPAGIFLFRASYLSDAREEDLVEIAIGLGDRRILRRLAEAVERFGLVPDAPEAWPMMPEITAADAYALARDELERRLLAPVGVRRRELASRLAHERGRAAAYYDEMMREIGEQQASLPAEAPERAALDAKLRAIRLERDGRTAELGRKYALAVEVSLLSVLRLYLPRLVVQGTLAGKRESAPLALVWDPVEQTGEPVRCQRCRALTYEIGLHRTGSVTCPSCVGAPITCRRR